MSKERYSEIVDEVYEKIMSEEDGTMHPRFLDYLEYDYTDNWPEGGPCWFYIKKITKEEFINKIKTDDVFSKLFGIKIEERELSLEERNEWFQINCNGNNPLMKSDWKDYELDQQNIPKLAITISYSHEKIEVYE